MNMGYQHIFTYYLLTNCKPGGVYEHRRQQVMVQKDLVEASCSTHERECRRLPSLLTVDVFVIKSTE